MDIAAQLPMLLGLAWLAPLASFVAILFFGPRMGHHGKNAAWVATTPCKPNTRPPRSNK